MAGVAKVPLALETDGTEDGTAPPVAFLRCPIQETLGVLGRRWSLLVLRDVGVYRRERFSLILRGNPGLTPRVLSRRLAELQREGLVRRSARSRKDVRYALTPKGRDALPILAAMVAYGIHHHADRVFADGTPRGMREAFPLARETLLDLVARDDRQFGPR